MSLRTKLGAIKNDLMRCAVTGGKKLKAYWVEVASVIAGGVMEVI